MCHTCKCTQLYKQQKTSKQTNINTNNLSLPPSLKVTFK